MKHYEMNWKPNKACATGDLEKDIPNVVLKTGPGGEAKVVLISDVHIGQTAFNKPLFEKFLAKVEEMRAYIALLGDLMEFAIPIHMPHTTFEQDIPTDRQMEVVRSYLEPMKDKIIYLTNGNHENRQWKKTGTDQSKILAEFLGTFYSKNGGFQQITVGSQEYLFSMHHGHSGGQANIWSELEKRWNYNPQSDLVALGHIHHLAHKSLPKFELVDGVVKRRFVHFVRTGSYLTNASYATEVGYPPTLDGSPIVTLSATQKLIQVDVRGEIAFNG